MAKETQSELEICNLNPLKQKEIKEFISSDESSEESGSNEDEDEDFEDYVKDGYHPIHLK